MSKVILLLSALMASGLLTSALEITSDQKKKWREALGSQDFQARARAMSEVWESGEDALSFLEELAQSDDPEIAARASVVGQKLRLGITPETSEKVVALLDQYLESSPHGRIAVLEKLRAQEEFDFILRLRRDEKNERVIARIDSMVARDRPYIVRKYLIEDKLEEAKGILGLSEKYDHIIQHGHLLDLAGELDQELERLRQGDLVKNKERYLAYLRVKGDAALLRKEAARLGDREAEVIAALVLGDHVPYFEHLLEVGKLGLPIQNYLKWALADHRGDAGARKEAYETILYLSKQDSEAHEARMNLFRMGLGKEVMEGLGGDYLGPKIGFHLIQEEYGKARELMGLPEYSKLEGWLTSVSRKVAEELENEGRGIETDRLIAAVEFLEGRGMFEEAERAALALFEAARGKPDLSQADLAGEIYYSAPQSSISAVVHEVEEHEATASVFLGGMLFSDSEHIWVFNLLGEMMPKMALRERLALTCSFSYRHALVSPARFDEIFEKIVSKVLKSEKALDGLNKMFQILQYRNREDELVRICEEQAKLGFDNHFLRYNIALDGGRIDDALDSLEKIEFKPGAVNSIFLAQRGLAFRLAGRKEWPEMMARARLLSSGTADELQEVASQQIRVGLVAESYETLRDALLRSEVFPEPGEYKQFYNVIDGLSADSATLGRWQEALAYREVAALISGAGSISEGILLMRNRFQILVARGALAMKSGEVAKAVAAFSDAHRILPRDGYLANELFPVLREVGLIELHDQLFAQSAEHAREALRMFPGDDNAYNNFAWLASRANRCLDEAERYLKKALEMKPQSAAYLDTMAEVCFARKDRAEALKWSALSLKNEVLGRASSRWELHQQRRRFESGGFPVR